MGTHFSVNILYFVWLNNGLQGLLKLVVFLKQRILIRTHIASFFKFLLVTIP